METIKELNNYCNRTNRRIIVNNGLLIGFGCQNVKDNLER